jgi:hypothetical protein
MNTPEQPLQTGRREFEVFVFMFIMAVVFMMASRTPLDSDLWWHIKSGEYTVTTGKPMLMDVFSYTRYGESWINHSWLSQVGIYYFFLTGRFFGLGLFTALAAMISMIFVYFQMKGSGLLRAFCIILGVLVVGVVWSPRPQIMSLVFVSAVSYILYLYKHKRFNLLWILPILFVLWSNMHGGYPLGIILIGTVVVGEAANRVFGQFRPETLSWKQIGILLAIGLLSLGLVVLNPNGINMWKIPFQTMGVNALQNFVSEWASPDFHEIYQQPMLWLLLAVMASFAFSGRVVDASDVIQMGVFAYMAFLARRNFGPFGLIATPILARYLYDGFQTWQNTQTGQRILSGFSSWKKRFSSGSFSNRSFPRNLNLILFGLITLAAIMKLYITSQSTLVNAYIQRDYPSGAVQWFRQTMPEGRILSEYNWGGYLIWALPEYPVFVDGRTDLYGDEIIGEWMQVVQGGDDWKSIINKWDIHYVMLEAEKPLIGQLANAGWRKVYQDATTLIYKKP